MTFLSMNLGSFGNVFIKSGANIVSSNLGMTRLTSDHTLYMVRCSIFNIVSLQLHNGLNNGCARAGLELFQRLLFLFSLSDQCSIKTVNGPSIYFVIAESNTCHRHIMGCDHRDRQMDNCCHSRGSL